MKSRTLVLITLTAAILLQSCSIFRLSHSNSNDPLYSDFKNPGNTLNNHLIAYYPFNNDLLDSTGNASHEGYMINGSYSFTNDRFGKISNSCYFNGSCVIVLPNMTTSTSNIYSWIFWIKDLSVDTNFRRWMVTSTSPVQSPGQVVIREVDSASGGGLQLLMGSSNAIITSAQSQFWKDGNWHMITIVSDGTNTKCYFDLELIITAGWCEIPYSILHIGGALNPANELFLGFMDDIRVLDTAIVQSEISNYYHENGW